MRVILDTNVFVSAVFFGGVPGKILEAWRKGTLRLVLSLDILDEYRRVGEILAGQYAGVDLEPLLALLVERAEIVKAPPLSEPVSTDPDDDKFLACAIAAGVTTVVSGDKHLVALAGWRGIRVLRPRQLADELSAER